MAERRAEQASRTGSIEIIFGSMFSGKSKELIRRLNILEISINARRASGLIDNDLKFEDLVAVFKPSVDNRRGDGTINSKDGDKREAISIVDPSEIVSHIAQRPTIRTIAIDEAQFFPTDSLVSTVTTLANMGVRVIVAGLAANFKGEKWGGIGDLIGIADSVDQLKAVCAVCGEGAMFTQRLVLKDGKWVPAGRSDPIVMVGDQQYQARCREHFKLGE